MALSIRLPRFENYTVELEKNRIHQGLFYDTLQLDPNATELDLEMPFLTPDIIKFAADLLNTGQIPYTVPENKENLRQAAGYLGLDILEVLADPLYPVWRQSNPGINLLDLATLSQGKTYLDAMTSAIRSRYTTLFRYILRNTPPMPVDSTLLPLVVLSNMTDSVRRLLGERKVDVMTASIPRGRIASIFREAVTVEGRFSLDYWVSVYFQSYKKIPQAYFFSLNAEDPEIVRIILPYLNPLRIDYFYNALTAKREDIAFQLLRTRQFKITRAVLNNFINSFAGVTSPEFLREALDMTVVKPKELDTIFNTFVIDHLQEPRGHMSIVDWDQYYAKYPQLNRELLTFASHRTATAHIRQVYALLSAISRDDLKTVQSLTGPEIIQPLSEFGSLLQAYIRTAVRYGRIEIYRYLLTGMGNTQRLYEIAVYNGKLEMLRELFESSPLDSYHRNEYFMGHLIGIAEQKGFREIEKELLVYQDSNRTI